MNRFEQTSIWQNTLAKRIEHDQHEKARELLRVQFESFRERAKLLAAEIARVLPEFTVHDITHIDALWETAELVTREDYKLTPAEAYVLGGAFLIHDLGMGLAAFPKGLEELRQQPIWKDTVASLLRKKTGGPVSDKEIENADLETIRLATENVLRLLHASQAAKLALISWEDNNKQSLFLIENSELRQSYGSIIGLIASSHWWPIDEIEKRFSRVLGAPGIFPSDWTVDPIRLACIMRVADAAQVDDRRAPNFLRVIRKPSKYSDQHWNFQQKLYQPRLENGRLVYTSKSAFDINEVESWWLCYDALQTIDKELKGVDALLADTNRERLKAVGVASVEDLNRLSKLIAVDGWYPVDAKIKVTNVAKLVGSLGGSELYGDNVKVPLRELIQNASDAVRARRVLEGEKESFGTVTVRIGKDDIGEYVEVEDDGVGMSVKVLTGPFVDFGHSFWGTSLMHEELPGLESKGFRSTGKYGIGFFSVFMWGDKVTIASKRYEDARDSTNILEFGGGLESRPILRKAKSDEVIKDGGTRVRVWLRSKELKRKLLETKGLKKPSLTLIELLETLCPALDANLTLVEDGNSTNVIKANDWQTISHESLVKRVLGRSRFNKFSKEEKMHFLSFSKNATLIRSEEGSIVGRAFIYPEDVFNRLTDKYFMPDLNGIVTVGGLSSNSLSGIKGILIGKTERASRDIGIPIVTANVLADWATNQAKLLENVELDEEIQFMCSKTIRACGGNINRLKVAYHSRETIDYCQLKDIISRLSPLVKEFIIAHDVSVSLYESKNKCEIKFLDNVFYVDGSGLFVLRYNYEALGYIMQWPNKMLKSTNDWFLFHNGTLQGLIIEAFHEVWGVSIDQVLNSSKISTDERSYKSIVGYANGEPVIIDNVDIIRRPK